MGNRQKKIDVDELVGKTLTKIIRDEKEEELFFHVDNGAIYRMYHDQDCCENVYIEDIVGNFDDLLGTPILKAEGVSSRGEESEDCNQDSSTWTFYHISTIKGTVTLRWYGTSNGYYSEEVDFERFKSPLGDERKDDNKELKGSGSACMATTEIPDPENPSRLPKYAKGQVVYFLGQAGHTDDLVGYTCVGTGQITAIRGRYSWEEPGIYYEIEESCDVNIEEADIYEDPKEAIKVLDSIYANETGDYPRGWYVFGRH